MSYQFGRVDPDERLDYVEELPAEEEYRPRSRLPGALLAIGVMAVFAGGLWFAYHEGTKHAAVSTLVSGTPSASSDQVPLIRADPDPVKVKPDKAGGMSIPDKDDPIYSMRPDGSHIEKLLPPPEAPTPRPTAPPPPVAAAPPAPVAQPAPPPPAQIAALPKPAAKPADPPAKPVAAGSPTKIQLASLRTPDEARDEWQRLKRDNADLLGKLTAVAVRADTGDRGIWYRVEVGPVGDRAAAVRLCQALKDRGLGCNLVQ
jgi:cell division septation protein DedD